MHAAQRIGVRLRLTSVLLWRVASTAWEQEPDFTTAHRLRILVPLAACCFRTNDYARPYRRTRRVASARVRGKGSSTPFLSLYLVLKGTSLISFLTYGSYQTRFQPVASRHPIAACCLHQVPGRIRASFLFLYSFIYYRCAHIPTATYGNLQTRF